MHLLTIVRVIAIACTGVLAGIYLGHRAGAHYALEVVSASSFVQFQQVIHVHYVRFMPPLVLTALLATVAWLGIRRSAWRSLEFWLVAASTVGLAIIIALTRLVSVPLNDQLMTWSIAAPPGNVRELWTPWEQVNTIRTLLSIGALVADAIAISLKAASATSR